MIKASVCPSVLFPFMCVVSLHHCFEWNWDYWRKKCNDDQSFVALSRFSHFMVTKLQEMVVHSFCDSGLNIK